MTLARRASKFELYLGLDQFRDWSANVRSGAMSGCGAQAKPKLKSAKRQTRLAE
jgi:hypothetical protein